MNVLLKLFEGVVQILSGTLVLPGKIAALPDIGPSGTTGCLRCSLFKAIGRSSLVNICRKWLIKQSANVMEMGLRCLLLVKLCVRPLRHKLIDRELV